MSTTTEIIDCEYPQRLPPFKRMVDVEWMMEGDVGTVDQFKGGVVVQRLDEVSVYFVVEW